MRLPLNFLLADLQRSPLQNSAIAFVRATVFQEQQIPCEISFIALRVLPIKMQDSPSGLACASSAK